VGSKETLMPASTADEAAFRDFVTARRAALTRSAYLLTHDHQLAEDLVQTALFKAAKAWDRIEGDPEPYVRRILFTESVSWHRRRRIQESLGAERDVLATPGTDLDLRLALVRALAQLTGRQRAVIVLRYYEDLTEAATAQALGVGIGTVKSLHRQAVHRLRTCAPHLGELIGTTHD
jgi:RNA polymerase sigma-70 factor (sigma-E family)